MGQRSRCGSPGPGEAGAGLSVDRIRASGGGNQGGYYFSDNTPNQTEFYAR